MDYWYKILHVDHFLTNLMNFLECLKKWSILLGHFYLHSQIIWPTHPEYLGLGPSLVSLKTYEQTNKQTKTLEYFARNWYQICYLSTLVQTLIPNSIAMFSLVSYVGTKMKETFQGKSRDLKPQLASKNLQASKPRVSSSERRTRTGSFLFSNSRSYLNYMRFFFSEFLNQSELRGYVCMADLNWK